MTHELSLVLKFGLAGNRGLFDLESLAVLSLEDGAVGWDIITSHEPNHISNG